MTKLELSPCPSCKSSGGNVMMNEIDRRPFVYCTLCRLCGPECKTNTEAADKWNMLLREDAEADVEVLLRLHETTDEIAHIFLLPVIDDFGFVVGNDGVTAIIAYSEYGRPWLSIYKGDRIDARIAADSVLITYKDAES